MTTYFCRDVIFLHDPWIPALGIRHEVPQLVFVKIDI
jgi:hypothetical protein